nr:pollen-specific leucine-rich repeat extensin-like protein 2 [Parasteatoda tepidariorum]
MSAERLRRGGKVFQPGRKPTPDDDYNSTALKEGALNMIRVLKALNDATANRTAQATETSKDSLDAPPTTEETPATDDTPEQPSQQSDETSTSEPETTAIEQIAEPMEEAQASEVVTKLNADSNRPEKKRKKKITSPASSTIPVPTPPSEDKNSSDAPPASHC